MDGGATGGDDVESWGWSEYFSQLQRFFADLERQYGIAQRSYCSYANERLEVCEVTMNRVLDVLDGGGGHKPAQGTVLYGLRERLIELRGLVRSLRLQWQQYAATIAHRAVQASYRATAIVPLLLCSFRATDCLFTVTFIYMGRDCFIAWNF